jgi:hypothetical protein
VSEKNNTVKPVLGGHSWGMSKVTSQERWSLKRGSVKTDQSCHQMDCQALSRNTFCTCIYGCKWTQVMLNNVVQSLFFKCICINVYTYICLYVNRQFDRS